MNDDPAGTPYAEARGLECRIIVHLALMPAISIAGICSKDAVSDAQAFTPLSKRQCSSAESDLFYCIPHNPIDTFSQRRSPSRRE